MLVFPSLALCQTGDTPSDSTTDLSSPSANLANNTQAEVERPPSPKLPANKSLSLAARIDALLEVQHPLLTAPRDTDSSLFRRLSLDLRGVVPTQTELDEFANDPSKQRWSQWVARFLDDPLCDEHLVQVLDRMLMLRRSYTQVERAAWMAFLREEVSQDAPLDQFTQRLLSAPWWHRQQRAEQRFFLDRGGDPNMIARDLGRVFLGRDLQCAQCHDHPQIDDYRQTDYHGLLAFVAPSKLADATAKDAEDKDITVQLYVELPAGDAPFESVFNKGVPYRSGPRLPDQIELPEDYQLPSERLQAQSPADALAGAPAPPLHSRRQLLAQQLTARSNTAFVANWANRWWAQVYGQGLVHPVDMQHVDNPPSHPQLYQLIAQGLIDADMRPKRFLSELVQTEAYQRGGWTMLQASTNSAVPLSLSSEPSDDLREWTTEELRKLAEAQTALAEVEGSAEAAYSKATDAWEEIQSQRAAIRVELDPAEAALIDQQKKANDATSTLATAQKSHADTLQQAAFLEEALEKLKQAAMVTGSEDAELKPVIESTTQRLTAAQEKLPAIEKQVSEAVAAREACTAPLQTAKDNVAQIVARLQPIAKALQEADVQMIAARTAWHQAYWRLADSKRRAECHLHTLAWLDSLADVQRIEADPQQGSLSAAHDMAIEKWNAVSQDAARNLATARLTPLSPEQLCWSILRITGQLDAYTQVELTELEKQSPLPADADAPTRKLRQQQALRAAVEKLRGYADIFVSLYASGPDKTQDDFFASADQALYTANSGSVFVWAGPGAGVTQQAIAQTDDAQAARALYGCLLCRQPTDNEVGLVVEHLTGVGEDRPAVIQEMVWSLLASAEFRFSY